MAARPGSPARPAPAQLAEDSPLSDERPKFNSISSSSSVSGRGEGGAETGYSKTDKQCAVFYIYTDWNTLNFAFLRGETRDDSSRSCERGTI